MKETQQTPLACHWSIYINTQQKMLWNSASLWLHPRSASLSLPVYRNTLFNAFCLYKTYSPEHWGWQPQMVYLASLWSSTLFGRSAAPTTFTLAHLSHLSARGDNTIQSSFIKRKKFPTLSFSGVNEQMGLSMNSFCLVFSRKNPTLMQALQSNAINTWTYFPTYNFGNG